MKFEGWITDKAAFFDKIDVFCLASRREAFGIALLEAMLHSKIVISTPTGGPTDVLGYGRYGTLSKTFHPEEIAKILQEVYANQSHFSNLAKTSYFRATEYSILNISRRLKLALEEMHYKILQKSY